MNGNLSYMFLIILFLFPFQQEKVIFRDGKDLTLKEVFETLNLTSYDLSVDTLDVHVSEKPSTAFPSLSPSSFPPPSILISDLSK